MLVFKKHTVNNTKGQGVVYTIKNFRFDEKNLQLKWDAFRFYTPMGELIDEQGFRYFDVDGEEYPIGRGLFNKGLIIKVG